MLKSCGLTGGLPRDYEHISKTVGGLMNTGQTTAEIDDQTRPTMGFDHVIFNVADDYHWRGESDHGVGSTP